MITSSLVPPAEAAQPKRDPIKCVVWDLDNTLWMGTLLEDPAVVIRPEAVEIVKLLDSRGVLNSIASRNEHEVALEELRKHRIAEYFLYPQINWGPKSGSVRAIAHELNLPVTSFAFIDDQAIEREEVSLGCPGILCLSDLAISQIPQMVELTSDVPTGDGSQRRKRYLADQERRRAEKEFSGPEEYFLQSLRMTLRISAATESDLNRIEELAIRTHQLNSTGRMYSRQELLDFCNSPHHKVYVAALEDRFGDYGKIGIALMECTRDVWRLKLLLVSCRVLNRGVGTIFLKFLMKSARQGGITLYSDFFQTDRNRIMYVTYRLAGFIEHRREGAYIELRDSLDLPADVPDYINLVTDELPATTRKHSDSL